MSFKGEIEAKCPTESCIPFETEVWSFVRGDSDEDLRLTILARELNLILCPTCQVPFFPDAPYVYYESRLEVLAFVFPESYKDKEAYWRDKMHSDFVQFKTGLGEKVSADLEPEIFFGVEGLAALLEREDYRGEEREVMEVFAKDLGLSIYRVSPRFAREHGVPPALPYAGPAQASRASVIAGLEKLVAANDRLTAYSSYLAELSAAPNAGLPPASRVKE
jgi:hypothetical protein